jgi:hypothetical protein
MPFIDNNSLWGYEYRFRDILIWNYTFYHSLGTFLGIENLKLLFRNQKIKNENLIVSANLTLGYR